IRLMTVHKNGKLFRSASALCRRSLARTIDISTSYTLGGALAPTAAVGIPVALLWSRSPWEAIINGATTFCFPAPTNTRGEVMEQAQAERRGEQRFPLRLPVVVRAIHGSIQEESSLTRDVSARGAFFYVDSRLAEGTPVEMILTLPAEI